MTHHAWIIPDWIKLIQHEFSRPFIIYLSRTWNNAKQEKNHIDPKMSWAADLWLKNRKKNEFSKQREYVAEAKVSNIKMKLLCTRQQREKEKPLKSTISSHNSPFLRIMWRLMSNVWCCVWLTSVNVIESSIVSGIIGAIALTRITTRDHHALSRHAQQRDIN
jgi:hypothetical protein